LAQTIFQEDFGLLDECVNKYFEQKKIFSQEAEHKKQDISATFWLIKDKDQSIGIIGISRYLWINPDVCWIRWIGAKRPVRREDMIKEAIAVSLEEGARMIVFEVSKKEDREILARLGFYNQKAIPNLYASAEEWKKLLEQEYKKGFVTTEKFEMAKGNPLSFYIYYKKIGE
jgi:N-acetylglutamate synthase-like GNAT family acetyltransferase